MHEGYVSLPGSVENEIRKERLKKEGNTKAIEIIENKEMEPKESRRMWAQY